MWDGFNKRKFPRINLRCELMIGNPAAGQVIKAQTDNLGAGGLCFLLDRPLERFSTVSLRVELNPDLPWIHCLGKVVWVVPSRDSLSKKENYDVGIEFLGLQPAEQDLIRSYVESRAEVS